MAKQGVLTQDEILLAAGVTAAQIAAIKTADATTAANFLDQIHEVLISFVSTQRIERANLNNPLKRLEKGYAAMNGGKLNGFFQEILVQARAKGNNGLYGGRAHRAKTIRNPYETQDWGAPPLSYLFGINASIERELEYDRYDFLMQLQAGTLDRYVDGKLGVLDAENWGSRYALENNVLNCEAFQYLPYAQCPVFENAADLNEFMHSVWAAQKYPEANFKYKKVPFNTTRGNTDLVFVLEDDFAFKFAQDFQYKQYLKPFVYRSEDSDTYGAQIKEESNIIMVDALTPTTLATISGTNPPLYQLLDPLNMTPATLPEGTRLIGRIVDNMACKFGVGMKTSVDYALNSRVSHYDETQDLCVNMCDAYVNVPLLVSEDFDANRKIHIINDTPVTPTPPPES